MSHPRTRLDDLIHQPVRFSLMAALAKAEELEFRFLRDALGISDSVLSRQASTLEDAGYVKIRKGFEGRRPRTWLSLSAVGRKTFDEHVQALREIAG